MKTFGRVDVLVNCAGVNPRNRSMAGLDPADWNRVIGINLTGALHCTQAVLPAMPGTESWVYYPHLVHFWDVRPGLVGCGLSGQQTRHLGPR